MSLMKVTQIKLQDFRNYTQKSVSFTSLCTIFVGPNTIGKTNLQEALFLLATGKSFRADQDSEMIREGAEIAHVKADVMLPKSTIKEEDLLKLEILLTRGEINGHKSLHKRFMINGVARRQIDFVGKLKCVLFWPDDLRLVTGSPSLRRQYLDFVLVQTDWEYRRSLISYERGLRQRNRLLEAIRDGKAGQNQLLFWDQLLIKAGNYISQKRSDYIDYINQTRTFFGKFRLEYDASVISEVRLQQYQEAQIAAATTLVGPHRDNFLFFEQKRDLAKFGSRGEQRLVTLWLKLAQLEYTSSVTGEKPLLLLDDIFSELDHKRREEIIDVVRQQQTILTTTEKDFVPQALLKEAEVIKLG